MNFNRRWFFHSWNLSFFIHFWTHVWRKEIHLKKEKICRLKWPTNQLYFYFIFLSKIKKDVRHSNEMWISINLNQFREMENKWLRSMRASKKTQKCSENFENASPQYIIYYIFRFKCVSRYAATTKPSTLFSLLNQ